MKIERSWIGHIKCSILAQACVVLDYCFLPDLIGSNVVINFSIIWQVLLSLGIKLAMLILSDLRESEDISFYFKYEQEAKANKQKK